MKFDNKVYDILKWVSQIVLPSLGTLYFALSMIWGIPYGEQVVGTLTALTAFLGAVIGISSHSYYKDGADGVLTIDTSSEEVDKYSIEVGDLDSLEKKDKITIMVNKP